MQITERHLLRLNLDYKTISQCDLLLSFLKILFFPQYDLVHASIFLALGNIWCWSIQSRAFLQLFCLQYWKDKTRGFMSLSSLLHVIEIDKEKEPKKYSYMSEE